ncbi:MAG TPA: hypothetical protein PLV92_16005 [Pirellulaceae bacterium]|nr:hypothetical protein [Pirellulaceae bacterium]
MRSRKAIVDRLREAGPEGMAELKRRRDERLRRSQGPPALEQTLREINVLTSMMDEVGGARYCSQSGLYWFTDFDAAKREAGKTGKPILVLRLLGNLSDEFSCANSRFFRVALYANEEISNYLRENYVLMWKTVRPVPKITIDFGDGRKLERTLTGNSAHYVLTSDGQVVDGLPGLFGPGEFLRQIKDAAAVARSVRAMPSSERQAALADWHRSQLTRALDRWESELAAVAPSLVASGAAGTPVATPPAVQAVAVPDPGVAVNPVVAANPNVTSNAVAPTAVASAAGPFAELERRLRTLERLMTDELWDALAQRRLGDSAIDAHSRLLMQAEAPNAARAGRLAITKRVVEDPLLRIVRNLERSMALDTVKNEFTLHGKLRLWLSAGSPVTANVDQLNELVYDQLFLMPLNDPWLGLAPPDVYTGLVRGGAVVAGKAE